VERHAVIVAGFGYRTGATIASLRSALLLAQAGAPPVTHVATVADKLPLLAALGLPMLAAEALDDIPTPTRSAASLAARGTGSVAEAAALAAAGAGARLLVVRQISPDRMATCAIAQGSPE
jgi:cobalt-precorrin 5A hydrolase